MLGLFESKGSKLATLIGQSLHAQILKGKERVGDDFIEHLNSPFTSSYIYSFIAKSFHQANYDSDAMVGKHLKTICEGIWPGVISQLIEKDIEILTELGKKSGTSWRKPDLDIKKSTQMLWSVAILEKDYPQ